MSRFGYTAEEKSRIRAGFQCPECFGANVETRTRIAFECRECGARWHTIDPQFQGASHA